MHDAGIDVALISELHSAYADLIQSAGYDYPFR